MTPDPILRRIRAEYREMPGLCLTAAQARRLWQLDRDTCDDALTRLLDEDFLHRTLEGFYIARPATRRGRPSWTLRRTIPAPLAQALVL